LTAEAADEFSELESVDIAAAKTAASISPHNPAGMSSTIKVANASSDTAIGVSGGEAA
jgi:hypothetical protein